MEFPRYESYKDSGIEWLGDIPSHWETVRARRIFRTVSEKGYPDAELLSVTQDQGVIPRTMLEQRVVMPMGQLETFKLVRKNDFVISLRSFQGGIEYSDYTGIVSPAYTVLRKQRKINSAYLKYLLKSATFISELNKNVTGIRQGKNIDFQDFSYSFLPIPELEEQERIARFLDEKTAVIDTAIAKKERLIALLEEQKQILVNTAVTRGLNPHAPTRPSGIDWISDIPAHWEVLPLKRIVATKITDGPHTTPQFVAKGYPFASAEAVFDGRVNLHKARGLISKEEHQKYCEKVKPQKDDIFMVKSGATTGKLAIVDFDEEFSVWSPLALIRANKKYVNPHYLFVCLQAQYFQKQVQTNWSQGTQPNIAMGDMEKLYVIIPPESEQSEITKFLDDIFSTIDESVTLIKNEVELLAEYRTVLIAEAVTGKIKL